MGIHKSKLMRQVENVIEKQNSDKYDTQIKQKTNLDQIINFEDKLDVSRRKEKLIPNIINSDLDKFLYQTCEISNDTIVKENETLVNKSNDSNNVKIESNSLYNKIVKNNENDNRINNLLESL